MKPVYLEFNELLLSANLYPRRKSRLHGPSQRCIIGSLSSIVWTECGFCFFSVLSEVYHGEVTRHQEGYQEKTGPDPQGKEEKQAGEEVVSQRF